MANDSPEPQRVWSYHTVTTAPSSSTSYYPAAAKPWTNSTSPKGRSSSGPSGRYMDLVSINTVDRMLCPLLMSADSCLKRVALVGNSDDSKVPEVVVGIANRKLGLQSGLYGQS